MKIKYVNSDLVIQLKNNAELYVEKYMGDEPWVNKEFNDTRWCNDSRIETIKPITLLPPDNGNAFDFENTKRVYEGLKHIDRIQASDERFWAYLTHYKFWSYMKRRWPIDDVIQSPANRIRDRYLFTGSKSKALVRNGLARLWWYGFLSYDSENSSNPYELTELLVGVHDIAHSVLERSFSNCRNVTLAILSVIGKYRNDERVAKYRYNKEKGFRAFYRHLLILLNYVAGVTVLDVLDREDVETILEDKAQMILARVE